MRQLYTGIWLILWCETEKPFSTTGFFFFFFFWIQQILKAYLVEGFEQCCLHFFDIHVNKKVCKITCNIV